MVFGLLKRAGKVHTTMLTDTTSRTLAGLIREHVQPDSVVYTDSFRSYDKLDVSGFHHHRINHHEQFADCHNHINGIENFWNQAKRHLRRYNGIPKAHFAAHFDAMGGNKRLIKTSLDVVVAQNLPKRRITNSYLGQPKFFCFFASR